LDKWALYFDFIFQSIGMRVIGINFGNCLIHKKEYFRILKKENGRQSIYHIIISAEDKRHYLCSKKYINERKVNDMV
jgi:hypothetical protein